MQKTLQGGGVFNTHITKLHSADRYQKRKCFNVQINTINT